MQANVTRALEMPFSFASDMNSNNVAIPAEGVTILTKFTAAELKVTICK